MSSELDIRVIEEGTSLTGKAYRISSPVPVAPVGYYLSKDEAPPSSDSEERLSLFDEDVCRCCGCTYSDPCDGGCWWVEANVCSNCQEHPWGGQETS